VRDTEQRKHTAKARKTLLYRAMAAAIVIQDEAQIAAFPKWYLERAEQAQQASEAVRDMAGLLVDMEHRNRLEAMTPEEVVQDLIDGYTYPGMTYRQHGWLAHLAFIIDQKVEELPYLYFGHAHS
jgi:hypothetical protein